MVDGVALREQAHVLHSVRVIVSRTDAEVREQDTVSNELKLRRNVQAHGAGANQQATVILDQRDVDAADG